MLYALIACLIIVTAGFLVLLDRKDRRDREERAVLLQRIQAPEAAVYEHAVRDEPEGKQHIFPMSDEMIAELEAREQALRAAQAREQAEYDQRLA